MTDASGQTPPGWYYAAGDPPGTQRYWDGGQWQGGPQAIAAGAPGSMAPSGPGLADTGKRVLARFIDLIIWTVLWILLGLAFGGTTTNDGGFNFNSNDASVLATILATLAVAGYEAFLVGTQGQTLGKMALGIRVQRLDVLPMDLVTGAKRIALYLISVIPLIGIFADLLLALVGIVMISTDSQKQAPWDKIAGTVVVDA